ncbi:MAG: hypothetical protein HC834_08385 [Rhodospirillales bacterium]|nr:hypothetical protein [Rhodospirillales bacterium]
MMQSADNQQQGHARAIDARASDARVSDDPHQRSTPSESDEKRSWKKLIYFSLRDRLIEQPQIFNALWRKRENDLYEKRVVRPDSALVIEGFPRCANTFAYYAFMLAQDKPVHLGNHMHCVAQFALAQKWKVPALLLVRQPMDTIASNYLFELGLPLEYHIRRYVTFHRLVKRHVDSLVVSDFPRTIGAFSDVIQEVNERFGTRFKALPDGEETQLRVNAEMKAKRDWRVQLGKKELKSYGASFPTEEKNKRKPMVIARLNEPKHRDLMKRAEEAYQALLAR